MYCHNVFCLLLFACIRLQMPVATAQCTSYHERDKKAAIDSLNLLYGRNKHLPPGYELQALMALSYYPELLEAPIRFVIKKTELPYASHPRLGTLLTPFARKKYKIIISRRSTALRESTLLKHLEFNAQVGALGHELAHTAYYSRSSKWKIIQDGWKYRKSAYKEEFEKMTDRIAIAHGLGAQIYAWSKAVYPVKKIDGDRGKIYYSPEEILEIWNIERSSIK